MHVTSNSESMEMIFYGLQHNDRDQYEHKEEDLELQVQVCGIGKDGKQNIIFTMEKFMLFAKTSDRVYKKTLPESIII